MIYRRYNKIRMIYRRYNKKYIYGTRTREGHINIYDAGIGCDVVRVLTEGSCGGG